MSSRQEEKARRKAEREARERAEAQKAARTRRLQIAAGSLLGIAAIAAVVVALASGGDGGDSADGAREAQSNAPIPAQRISDLDEAAKAAGCEVRSFESEGREHSEDTFDGYKTNPPTSGTHNPVPAEDGIYPPGNEPPVNNWVHTLEHGRIIFMYKPGTPKRVVDQLETLVNEDFKGASGYHQVLMQNNSEMPYQVAAVGWTRFVGCKQFNDKVFDAFRAFRERYVDKAPEFIP